jgi:hypothetical protein
VASPASAQYGTFVPKVPAKPASPPLAHTAQPPTSSPATPTSGLPFTGTSLLPVLVVAVVVVALGVWLRTRLN